MINLIKKIFIKNYNQTENEKVRLKYGLVAGVFGIISNLIFSLESEILFLKSDCKILTPQENIKEINNSF